MVDFVAGLLVGWILRDLMERRLRQIDRRRGSNPPPPGRKPAPPAGPPEQPLAAQPIRYWAWEQEQVRRAIEDEPTRFDEGQTQRGNGNGGPSTPNPPIKPQPTGGHLVQEGRLWGGYQPRPQGGTPNPPPYEP